MACCRAAWARLLLALITQSIPKAIRMVIKPIFILALLQEDMTSHLPRTPKRMNKDLARGVKPLCGSTLTAVARLEGMAEPTTREDVKNDEDSDCGAVTANGAGTV